tara:strand:- start:18015 stop:19424 length:1410 start_codon:yes stop_codon:yes gene_type:complete
MIFSSLIFPVFFALVIGAMLLSQNSGYRKTILLVASYVFYGWWDIRFLALIWLTTSLDYFLGGRIFRTTDSRLRKRYLGFSLCLNLGILGIFKYFNFFIESANRLLTPLGWGVSTLEIILPVGISFFTFQSMSYSIDIYRDKLKPADSFRDFALFIAFFPQLVAGPIVRAKEFLPQLRNPVRFTPANFSNGIVIFLSGLIKKALIADRLAIYVDSVYGASDTYHAATLWLALIAYSLQIFCDFSGYSEMAIGLALCLGFRLPKNFNIPYSATSIRDFWHRWHISLSAWLRDYLYISLGGNRKGRGRTYVNLMTTMVLGGLWHGASWNFVLWGFLHGGALAINRYWENAKLGWPSGWIGQFLGWIITMTIVGFGWLLFRIPTLSEGLTIANRMLFDHGPGIEWIYAPLLILLPMVFVAHAVGRYRETHSLSPYPPLDLTTFKGQLIVAVLLLGVLLYSPIGSSPFIYFQF